jgi:anti-anti-sigma factor
VVPGRQQLVNLDKVGFLDSADLGVLVRGLRPVRAHYGSLDLVCRQQRILKILKITALRPRRTRSTPSVR